MRVHAIVLSAFLAGFVPPAHSQQTLEGDTVLDTQWPIPRNKVAPDEDEIGDRPDDPATVPANDGSPPIPDGDTLIGLTQSDDGSRRSPRIRRPGVEVQGADEGRTIIETRLDPPKPDPSTDSAGAEDNRDGRFKQVPQDRRTSGGSSYEPGVIPIRTAATELRRGARLRQLDKMTGKISTFDLGVGQSARAERLEVRLDACRSPFDNDTHGAMAFLRIWDTKHPDDPPAFSGWMFAESPGLSALDHPRYDLWVISCTTSAGEQSVSE